MNALIAECRRLRKLAGPSKRLVRMARDWDNERLSENTWHHRYGITNLFHPAAVFARAILAQAKKKVQ